MKFITDKFVPDWKEAWRWFSVQAMTITGVISAAWIAVPEDLRSTINPDWLAIAAIALMVFGVLGRLANQKKGKDE